MVTIGELKRIIDRIPDDAGLFIEEYVEGAAGGTPCVEVQSILLGFDWDAGKVMIEPSVKMSRHLNDMSTKLKTQLMWISKTLDWQVTWLSKNTGVVSRNCGLSKSRFKANLEDGTIELKRIPGTLKVGALNKGVTKDILRLTGILSGNRGDLKIRVGLIDEDGVVYSVRSTAFKKADLTNGVVNRSLGVGEVIIID